MFLGDDLVEARFVRRANRFLAYVHMDDGETAVHVANSGRLRELFVPGAHVWLKPTPRPGRKTAYDLVLVEAQGTLVSSDARLPNALVAESLQGGLLSETGALSSVTRESQFGESRFDLLLESEDGKLYVEVKSVTLIENGVGLFPDSPTIRGAKHLNTLVHAVDAGHRGAVVFVVQRADCHSFAINQPADPMLAEAFQYAVKRGVSAFAYNCEVTTREVRINCRLPIVSLDATRTEAGKDQ